MADGDRPDWAVELIREIACLTTAQQGLKETTERGFEDVKARLDKVNGTLREHGEKLASHDTYLGLSGLGSIGAIITAAARWLIK